jgi:hypothetical protein
MTLVEEVSGRPITEFQEPGRPIHPYIQAMCPPGSPPRVARSPIARPISAHAAAPTPDEEDLDPVHRVYPPLTGSTGRALHGPGLEHHEATLRSVAAPLAGSTEPARPPGPSRRPERIYLHYLLLHLDRLSATSLRYLKHAVDEEVAHRETAAALPPTPTPAPTEPSTGP